MQNLRMKRRSIIFARLKNPNPSIVGINPPNSLTATPGGRLFKKEKEGVFTPHTQRGPFDFDSTRRRGVPHLDVKPHNTLKREPLEFDL
jgi:hypothetical protein